ncbi:OLC1v1029990C1 [Oldenlandia corymbosa var. corymbosa]|uniref:Glycosyltransferase n=1 Tax=Oldenlandia corymbosa var. corymbosa TaxID=529605 RepID=A0AAV1CEZ2_OLDCO|nr:OLC1v1029990C1 [Oldenlandia corymbosa var. corymbosa]
METPAQPNSKPHVAFLPSPGMGHLIPFIELAKRLVDHHHFSVTILLPSDGSPSPNKAQQSFLQSLPAAITSVYLPPPDFADLPENTRVETRIGLSVSRSLPAIRAALTELFTGNGSRLVSALVVDLFGSTAFELAKELGILSYMFFTSTAMSLSLLLHMPQLDRAHDCEFRDLSGPVELPGCVPLSGKDFLDGIQDRKNDAYKTLLELSKKYSQADGILINTFMELEYGALNALKEEKRFESRVYAVGPLVKTSSDEIASDIDQSSDCLTWLSKQPARSVLYISFGSGGTLSQEQITELAFGLEMSGQRFLWVVRSPIENAKDAAFFTNESSKDPFDFLPLGFLERTESKGLVIPSWAPQIEILSHESTGGFVSHCGWNSVLESVVNGVPLIAWPHYAEQKMNAILLTEDLKAAVRVKPDSENGIIEREQIARVAKGLIEGEEGNEVRGKIKELKIAAERAFRKDVGSSSLSLDEVAKKWGA